MVCFLLLMACGSASKKPVIIIDKTIPKAQIVLTEEQKQSYQKALRFMEQKNFADAESIFNKLIKSQPELTGAYVNLGAIKKADNKPDEAEGFFTSALKINPNFIDALLQQALIFQDKGEFTKAEDLLRRAEAINPDHPLVNYNLGVLYELYLQDYALAVQHYKRYITLSSAEDVETVKRWILLLERK
tara:strand:- start:46786 stop:47349 length:564 start_codon:yes stop_codon:yes gene_type:complete